MLATTSRIVQLFVSAMKIFPFVDENTLRLVKRGAGGRASVAGVAGGAVAGYDGDSAGGGHFEDLARQVGFRNVDIPGGVERNAHWISEAGLGCGQIIGAAAGDGVDCILGEQELGRAERDG